MAIKDFISMGIGPTGGTKWFLTLGLGTFEVVIMTPRQLTLRDRDNALTLRRRVNTLTLRERT